MVKRILNVIKQTKDFIGNVNRISLKPKKEKIRVGFILQMVEIWDKEIKIFEEMDNRNNFEVIPIVVPPFDIVSYRMSKVYSNVYFLSKYPQAIKAIKEDGAIFDISSLDLDYIFYQRPYNHYLPFELQSQQLSKISKCCVIPYGFVGADNFIVCNIIRDFTCDMYFSFYESDYIRNIARKKFFFTYMLKKQFFESLGYPCLEEYSIVDGKEAIETITWTPRWCFNEEQISSTFVENKDVFLKISQKYDKKDFVFRPHPLMFEEIKRISLMSDDEVKEYKMKLSECGIKYDSGTMLDEALNKADLLITDYSSIIINYFLSGKPIIYCESKAKLIPEYKRIIDCCYVAKNSSDIEKYVDLLLSGEDPLREKRIKIAKEIAEFHKGATKRIVDKIEADYYRR